MTAPQKAALLHTLLQLAISAAIVFLEAIGTLLLAPNSNDSRLIITQAATLAVFSFINGALHYLKVNDPGLLPVIEAAQPALVNTEEQFWKDAGGKGTLPTGTTGVIASVPGNPPAVQLPSVPKTL